MLEVCNTCDGTPAGRTTTATADHLEQAVSAADAVAATFAAVPAAVPAQALDHVSRRLGERLGEFEFARLITAESGKALKSARVEVTRRRDRAP